MTDKRANNPNLCPDCGGILYNKDNLLLVCTKCDFSTPMKRKDDIHIKTIAQLKTDWA